MRKKSLNVEDIGCLTTRTRYIVLFLGEKKLEIIMNATFTLKWNLTIQKHIRRLVFEVTLSTTTKLEGNLQIWLARGVCYAILVELKTISGNNLFYAAKKTKTSMPTFSYGAPSGSFVIWNQNVFNYGNCCDLHLDLSLKNSLIFCNFLIIWTHDSGSACISSIASNMVVLNFTLICMGSEFNNVSRSEKLFMGDISKPSDLQTNSNDMENRGPYDYSQSEKSYLMWAVAVGTLVAAWPFHW